MYGIHRYVNYICFDSYIKSHSITVLSEGSFTRDLCLMRYDYTVFNNYAITIEEPHDCMSSFSFL